MLIPTSVVTPAVAAEFTAATAWADRNGLPSSFNAETLRCEVTMFGPDAAGIQDAERYMLVGELDSFPAIPPAWRFEHPITGTRDASAYPVVPSPPFGSGLFTSGGPDGSLICAPFNRLAYTDHQGIHGDWGAATTWRTPRPPYTSVTRVGDMLARIWREVLTSRGRAG
ncbi:MAG: hypothetical protein ACR2LK_09770 [Solirubrobacteraceae bacterium]